MLCSDSLSGRVDDAAIAAVLANRDASESAEELVEPALAAGGEDNVSVQVVAFEPAEGGLAGRRPMPGRHRRPTASPSAIAWTGAAGPCWPLESC